MNNAKTGTDVVKKQAITKNIQSCIDSLKSFLESIPCEAIKVDENVRYKWEHCYELHIAPKNSNACSLSIVISSRGGNGKGEFDLLLDGDFHEEEVEFDASLILGICKAVSEGKVMKHQRYRDTKLMDAYIVVNHATNIEFRLMSNISESIFKRMLLWILGRKGEIFEKTIDYSPWV